jgi:hypothetical protein
MLVDSATTVNNRILHFLLVMEARRMGDLVATAAGGRIYGRREVLLL